MFGLQKLASAFDKKGKRNADTVVPADRLVAGMNDAIWLKFLKPEEKQDFIRIFTHSILVSKEINLSDAMTAAANAAGYILKKQEQLNPAQAKPDTMAVAETIVSDALKATENIPSEVISLRASAVKNGIAPGPKASHHTLEVVG